MSAKDFLHLFKISSVMSSNLKENSDIIELNRLEGNRIGRVKNSYELLGVSKYGENLSLIN